MAPRAGTIYQDNWIGEQAIALLTRRPMDKPFFIEISHQAPHPPMVRRAHTEWIYIQIRKILMYYHRIDLNRSGKTLVPHTTPLVLGSLKLDRLSPSLSLSLSL